MIKKSEKGILGYGILRLVGTLEPKKNSTYGPIVNHGFSYKRSKDGKEKTLEICCGIRVPLHQKCQVCKQVQQGVELQQYEFKTITDNNRSRSVSRRDSTASTSSVSSTHSNQSVKSSVADDSKSKRDSFFTLLKQTRQDNNNRSDRSAARGRGRGRGRGKN